MVNLITHLIFRSIIKIFVPLTSLNCFIFQKEVAVYSPKIEINPKSIFYFEICRYVEIYRYIVFHRYVSFDDFNIKQNVLFT